jgi:hypothetical protein
LREERRRESEAALVAQRQQSTQFDAEMQELRREVDRRQADADTQRVQVTGLDAEIQTLESALLSLEATQNLVEDPLVFASGREALQHAKEQRSQRRADAQGRLEARERELAGALGALQTSTSLREKQRLEIERLQDSVAGIQREADAAAANREALMKTCRELLQAIQVDAQNRHAIAQERPLSPEQFGWSILRSTGVLQNYVAAESAELEKQQALPGDATQEQRQARELQTVRGAMEKLRANVDVFSNLYASGVGQTSDEFFASPDQALYVSNGGAVVAWAAPNGSNLTSLIAQESEASAAARRLMWALLSREPTAQEQQWISEIWSHAAEQRPTVAHELVWGILAGAEYRLYP